MPQILHGESSFGTMRSDPPRHSWALRSHPHPDISTNRSSVDSNFVSSYLDYRFGENSCGFSDDQYNYSNGLICDAFYYDVMLLTMQCHFYAKLYMLI